MSPEVILFVLSLSAPLDSSSFPTRERGRVTLNKAEPIDAFPAVLALSRAKSPEVSEAARRSAERWPEMAYERQVSNINGQLDKLLYAAVHGPIVDKPWRAISDFEHAIPTQQLWEQWVFKAWREKLKPMYTAKYKDKPTWDIGGPSGPLTVFCIGQEASSFSRGQLAGIIWNIRIIEAGGGKYVYPNSKDW